MSPPGSLGVRVVVTDINILINFIHIGRLDLLAKLPPYSFVVPEEVLNEVSDSDQTQALQVAISSGALAVAQLTYPAELSIYANLLSSKLSPFIRRFAFSTNRACIILHLMV